jgi:hypothetical protein
MASRNVWAFVLSPVKINEGVLSNAPFSPFLVGAADGAMMVMFAYSSLFYL